MTQALIYTGGISHPFDDAAPTLADILIAAGFASRVSFELPEVLAWAEHDPAALLVIYALRWSMTQDPKYAPDRARWGLALPADVRAAIARHVAGGGGLLGIHTASICFDDWPGWRDVLGGAWQWGKSFHPLLGPVSARLNVEHFLTRGLPDFTLIDEVYSELQLAPGIDIAGWASAGASSDFQPAIWTYQYGAGRVVYDSLGHDSASLQHPVHRRLLQRAALWASGTPDHIVEAA